MGRTPLLAKAVDQHLGEHLQRLRESRGLSMSAVGRSIDTTYQQVRKYETGQNRISASTLFRLAQLLEVEVGDFFKDLPAGQGTRSGGDAPFSAMFDRTLGQIEDREVRHHLGGLLQALGARR